METKFFKRVLDTTKGKPNMTYHFIWFLLSELMGVALVFTACVYAFGIAFGLFVGIVLLAAGTLALLILPILFNIVFAVFPKYLSVLALPGYVIMAIGRACGEVNLLSEYGYLYPLLISIVLTLFGYVNIITSLKARKEVGEEDSSYIIFPFNL